MKTLEFLIVSDVKYANFFLLLNSMRNKEYFIIHPRAFSS